jgi:flavin reductase (DIM6/NTAB) family NADH-FMN oxidoreductase RutF
MDPETRRTALRKLTYGVHVMTAAAEGKLTGATLTWIAQCSFEPPLVMIAIQRSSQMHEAVERSGALAVNVIAEGQEKVAEAFFRPPSLEGNRLAGFQYEPGPATGAPLLTDLPAWIEARVIDAVTRGDHTVFVAQVIGAGVRAARAEPLLLSKTPWAYGG